MARRLTEEDAITAATLARLPPELLLGVWQQESSGRTDVSDSPKGAVGPFQVMPDTFRRYMPKGSDIRNPVDNMLASIAVLSDGWEKSGGDVKKTGQFYYHGRFLQPGKRGPTSGPGTPDTLGYSEQFAQKVEKARMGLGKADTAPITKSTEGFSNPVYGVPSSSMPRMSRDYDMEELPLYGDVLDQSDAITMPEMSNDFNPAEGPPDDDLDSLEAPPMEIAGLTRPLDMAQEPMGDTMMAGEAERDYELDNFIRSLVDEEFRNSRSG